MRCHMAMNPAPRDENPIESDIGFEDGGDGDGGGQTGYGLRENPKKSWRLSGSNQTAPKQEEEQEREQDHICKVCGKGFNSSRAVFGHMRHHSRQENLCRECGKGFSSLRALSGHMRCHSERFRAIDESRTSCQSQDETSCPTRRKRSQRYKMTSNPSFSNFNDSSSVTLSEPELEEGALCLMLLSRAVRSWEEFYSVPESSDNNSVIAEAKSSHQNTPIIKDEGENFVSDGRETSKMLKEKEKMLESCVLESGNVLFEKKTTETGSSDSGFVSHHETRVELEVCADDGLKKKLDVESQYELCDSEIEKKFHSEIKIKTTDVELGNIDLLTIGLQEANSEYVKHNSSKRAKCEPSEPDLEGNFCNKRSPAAQNKRIYKCSICSKIFQSHRVLGGHRMRCLASKSKSCGKSIQTNKILPDGKANSKLEKREYNENSIGQEAARVSGRNCELKRSKDYECEICFKVFASGQALGGHKRAHYAGSSETGEEGTTLVQQEHSDVSDIFDLNLPIAPEEGGANEHVGFKPWCFRGGHHEHESLVGVISN